jgi:hypothetical protein
MLLTLIIAASVAAITPSGPPKSLPQPPTLDAAMRAHSLDVLARRMDHYVFPARKASIVARLQARRADFLAIQDQGAFIQAVNRELLSASGDRHLQIFLATPDAPQPTDDPSGDFGVGQVTWLPGNVALLPFTGFSQHPWSREAVDRALKQVADASALVIDLRRNGGGGEVSYHRLLGHLFPARRELAAIEWRECAPPIPLKRPDSCRQIAPRLERRFTDTPAKPAFASRPVFVLTSADTFSAAEAVAWELQRAGRAKVVGERTGGGGNPSAGMDLESPLVVAMPIGRLDPRLGRGWEGRGVQPDVHLSGDALARVKSMIKQIAAQKTGVTG